jgi:hypothetical protein
MVIDLIQMRLIHVYKLVDQSADVPGAGNRVVNEVYA